MDFKSLRLVFMGTPHFAVASLKALVQAGCNIVGVITAPDKPAGRGMRLQQSPVKEYATEKGLTVLQPLKLKDPQFLEQLQSLKPDLQLVVAFRMLPEVVWNLPPLGTINLHASLLPQYRGAAPINWAVINGEKETGLTTFKLQQQIDIGNILLQQTLKIGDTETAGELHDRMMETGAQLLVKTVQAIAEKTLTEKPQSVLIFPDKKLLDAPKIHTETCRIDWEKNVTEIYNLIRGLSPYPAAFTLLQNKTIKIFKAEKEQCVSTSLPGSWETDKKTFLKFAASNGFIHLKDLQLEGKKRMPVEEFLRGFRFD